MSLDDRSKRASQLLNIGRTLIESEGRDVITVRRLAREAGVSPAAFYRHYACLNDFLDDLRCEGFEALAKRLRGCDVLPGPLNFIRGSHLEAYLQFASRHPVLFQLMQFGGGGTRPVPEQSIALFDDFKRLSSGIESSGGWGVDVLAVYRWAVMQSLAYQIACQRFPSAEGIASNPFLSDQLG